MELGCRTSARRRSPARAGQWQLAGRAGISPRCITAARLYLAVFDGTGCRLGGAAVCIFGGCSCHAERKGFCQGHAKKLQEDSNSGHLQSQLLRPHGRQRVVLLPPLACSVFSKAHKEEHILTRGAFREILHPLLFPSLSKNTAQPVSTGIRASRH